VFFTKQKQDCMLYYFHVGEKWEDLMWLHDDLTDPAAT